MPPALLDSSFLIDLEREIDSGRPGPALQWLRRNRALPDRPLLVSSITVAEFLEGFDDEARGLAFIARFIPQTIGFKHARKCAELQRRARKAGKRFGENDAWQLAFAECAHANIVGRDRKAFAHLGSRYERFAEQSPPPQLTPPPSPRAPADTPPSPPLADPRPQTRSAQS